MMIMQIILTCFVVLVCAFAFFIFLQNQDLKNRNRVLTSTLRITENKLQLNVIDIDNLVMRLAGLHEFGLNVTGLISKRELSNVVIDTACSIINSDSASLMLINNKNELYIISAKGLPQNIVEKTKIKVGEGIAGRVAATGKYLFVEDIESDIRFLRPNDTERYLSKSFISVPLRVNNRIIGVLNINSPKTKEQFTDRDVKLLTILADQAAMSLDNMELYFNLQTFYTEMVQALARTIDAKDSYTYDHADRAKYYAKLIAEGMKLPKIIVRYVEYAALMHDVGKIGISDEILLKTTKLNDDEREEIKKHPAIGYRIIAPVRFLAPVAPMVLYHQEWYNGGGYPEGLSGEEIPLGARIVAVIDAYDAMTSNRPYRKALSQEVAFAELKKGAGIQFDPKIVDVFIDILVREQKKEQDE